MRVGVLEETSGRVRDAFIACGHDAVSCDILPSEQPGPHIVGDVFDQDWDGFDLLICHPPCTRLCNSGVRWLEERNLWKEMEDAARFFARHFDLPVPRIGAENPIMHKYALDIIGWGPTQYIQPWMFGDGETKATGLWLKNLPPLSIDTPLFAECRVVAGREQRVHHEPPGPDRWKNRSRTYRGIASAFAEQWGSLPQESHQ